MAENNNIDTLVILVVADEQLSELTHKLVAGKFYFTRVEAAADSCSGLLPACSWAFLARAWRNC